MIALLSLVLVAAYGAIGVALAGGHMDWLVDYRILATFSLGLLASLAVSLLSALVLPFAALGRGRVIGWILLIIAGLVPLGASVHGAGIDNLRKPLMHDITTDVRNPPPMVFIAELRGPRDNPVVYAGQRPAALQRLHYPDVQPIEVALPPQQALTLMTDLVQREGLELVGIDGDALRIEATWRTPGLRLHHDVVVRVSPVPRGSRIDVRSSSRVGAADLGNNARLVRQLLSGVRATIRPAL